MYHPRLLVHCVCCASDDLMAYTNLFIIGTAGIVGGAGSVHVGRVHVGRLPVPAWAAAANFAANFAAVVYQLVHTHSSVACSRRMRVCVVYIRSS